MNKETTITFCFTDTGCDSFMSNKVKLTMCKITQFNSELDTCESYLLKALKYGGSINTLDMKKNYVYDIQLFR